MFTVTTMQELPDRQGSVQQIVSEGATPRRGSILFTAGLRAGAAVNVILYYHGNMYAGFDGLRSRIHGAVAGAGKPLAFVMPALENTPGTGSWAATQANFDSLIDGALLGAAQQSNEQAAGRCLVDRNQEWTRTGPTGNRVAPATLGNLILAAHSGGGFPMWTAVNNRSPKLSNLKELWFFDCLYANMDAPWIRWARANSGITMEILYTVQPPNETSANLARSVERAARAKPPLPNVRAVTKEPSNNHNEVGPNNLGRLIRVSSNL